MADMTTDSSPALRPRILVVDDDVAIGGTIKRYLRQFDIEVSDCVEDALAQLGDHTYDLLLLDRRLPDGLGDTVVEHVRAKCGPRLGSSIQIQIRPDCIE